MEPVVPTPHWPVGSPPYHWEYIWGRWAWVSAPLPPSTGWGPLLGQGSPPPPPMEPTEPEPLELTQPEPEPEPEPA